MRSSCLQLVDLAGSESMKDADATDQRGTEGRMINRSLSSLSHLVNTLSSQKQSGGEPSSTPLKSAPSRSHLFRDSPLLQVLQESLGGNCRTTFLVTINPDPNCLVQTRSTLHFAQNAKKIKNSARINAKVMADYMPIAQLREAYKNMQAENLLLGQHNAMLQLQSDLSSREFDKVHESALANHSLELSISKSREAELEQQNMKLRDELHRLKTSLSDKVSEVDRIKKSASSTSSLFSSPIRYPSGPLLNSPIRTPTAGSRLGQAERELRDAQTALEQMQADADAAQQEKERLQAEHERELMAVKSDFELLEELQDGNMSAIAELQGQVVAKDILIEALNKKLADSEVRFATMKRDIIDAAKAAQSQVCSLQLQIEEKNAKLDQLTKKMKSDAKKAASEQAKQQKKRAELEERQAEQEAYQTAGEAQELFEANQLLEQKVKDYEKAANKAAKSAYDQQKLNDRLMRASLHLAALYKKRTTIQDIGKEQVDIPSKIQGCTLASEDGCEEDRFSVLWTSKAKVTLVRRSQLERHFSDLIEQFEQSPTAKSMSSPAKKRAAAVTLKAKTAAATAKENASPISTIDKVEISTPAEDTPTKRSRTKKSRVAPATPLSPTSAQIIATNGTPYAPNVSVEGAYEATSASAL